MGDEKKQDVDTQTTSEEKAQEKKEQKKSENKSEEEKTKKQVAQKGENGEIVFKNQDELDGFIRRMYAKGAEKAGNGETSKQVQETQKEEQEDTKQQKQEQVVPEDYLSTKIALAMAKAGVNAERVERAARLVDTAKILENGVISDKKLEDEINAVVAEFPELKDTKDEEKKEKGFKFGATQSEEKNAKQEKSIPKKRWNRFNSI